MRSVRTSVDPAPRSRTLPRTHPPTHTHTHTHIHVRTSVGRGSIAAIGALNRGGVNASLSNIRGGYRSGDCSSSHPTFFSSCRQECTRSLYLVYITRRACVSLSLPLPPPPLPPSLPLSLSLFLSFSLSFPLSFSLPSLSLSLSLSLSVWRRIGRLLLYSARVCVAWGWCYGLPLPVTVCIVEGVKVPGRVGVGQFLPVQFPCSMAQHSMARIRDGMGGDGVVVAG